MIKAKYEAHVNDVDKLATIYLGTIIGLKWDNLDTVKRDLNRYIGNNSDKVHYVNGEAFGKILNIEFKKRGNGAKNRKTVFLF